MATGNDNLPSVSISAYCCIHFLSLLACVSRLKALAIGRDRHTALLLFMQMERVDDRREIKGTERTGKKHNSLRQVWDLSMGLYSVVSVYSKSRVQHFLRTDNQSHPQETLHISWNRMVKFLCSPDTNTGRHLEWVTPSLATHQLSILTED